MFIPNYHSGYYWCGEFWHEDFRYGVLTCLVPPWHLYIIASNVLSGYIIGVSPSRQNRDRRFTTYNAQQKHNAHHARSVNKLSQKRYMQQQARWHCDSKQTKAIRRHIELYFFAWLWVFTRSIFNVMIMRCKTSLWASYYVNEIIIMNNSIILLMITMMTVIEISPILDTVIS